MKILIELANAPAATRLNVFRRVGQMILYDALIALLLFISAGSLAWPWAWFYTSIMVLIQLVGASFMPMDMLAERGSKKENTEKWDQLLTRLILPCFLGAYLVAGLDFRAHWSPVFACGWHFGGVLFFILGCALEMWALRLNHFFSTEVRIQSERGHLVCTSGPYQYVRHPGYAGMLLYHLATPLFLGSLWALIPASLVAILLVVRSGLEDRTLQNKLPGYKEYATRVRYRLLPGIW